MDPGDFQNFPKIAIFIAKLKAILNMETTVEVYFIFCGSCICQSEVKYVKIIFFKKIPKFWDFLKKISKKGVTIFIVKYEN